MVVGELTQERDLVIIGAGPGGYHAAIRAAQLGLGVTLIEKGEMGGLCLNEGCIPSKVHTAAAQNLHRLNGMKSMGIETADTTFDMRTLQEYKNATIQQLKQGIEALCKANKIEVLKGEAMFLSQDKIGVENGHQYDTYSFKHAIIAAGKEKKPIINLEGNYLTITTLWKLDEIPPSLILYGNDDFTVEAAMCFSKMGSDVTMIFPKGQNDFTFDDSINKELNRQCKKQKIKLIKDVKVNNIHYSDNSWEVEVQNPDGKLQTLKGSHLYVESKPGGMKEGLGLSRAGIELDDDGSVKVNHACQTSVGHIYAIGDITDGPALAVKAIKQAKVAAENIAGYQSEIDLTFVPRVLHTIPPIASVGFSEKEAIDAGYEITVGESAFRTNGFASILGQKDGIVKTISERGTDLILGVHMMGEGAIELISSGIVALEMVGRQEDLLFPLYPHPSLNENFLESLEDLSNKAIHKPPATKKNKVNV
ncbi:FAD-dependent oxidoreductase [Bacillus tianshenii]|uniref:dihydrolipoyl dehydrogenase family protein n=1 Tax=Sutcliffiella tianshenii TaxID=1463404 RepID=UPI001CD71EFD|nr:FAD-dependent oxidoreductase [Bacillus tianshenii]MCA1319553.1 FAD-dependent oxidoreductase [Bacillus tianshenii]